MADGQVFDRRVERVGVTDLASLADQQGFSGAEYHHFAIRLHLLGSAHHQGVLVNRWILV